MARVVGGYFTSHVPAIGGAMARSEEGLPYWKPFFDAFPPLRSWLDRVRPDVVVVFSNDHGLNFFLDAMPTFAVGAAETFENADEGWGLPLYAAFPGHAALSWHVIEELVASDFDVTTCQKMAVDHAVSIPIELAWPAADHGERPVRLVPISINTVQYPLPSPRRCLALGQAVARALASWPGPERILVVGTGGLSHQLDGARAGFINPEYDRFCLDNIAAHPEALTAHSAEQVAELAGTQGVEIINWIAARGAMGPDVPREVLRNYHIPISNTAAATLVLEPA